MDIKSLLIVVGAAFLLLSNNSCSLSGVQQGVQVVTAGVSDATEMLNADPNADMNPDCLGAAQSQLSPHWANMSRLDRALMGLQIVTTCADGGGQ
jgi:hypothetical protein